MNHALSLAITKLLRLSMAIAVCLPAAVIAAEPPVPPSAQTEVVTSTDPESALTPEALYLFLLAEIAGARGQTQLSSQLYIKLAQETQDPRIAKRATEIALFSRNQPEAKEAAQIWVAIEPESEDARRMLAVAESGGDGRLEEIQSQIIRALRRSPESLPQNLLGLNRALARIGDKAAIEGIVTRVTEPYLKHPEAHFARAQAAMIVGDTMSAMTAINQALALKPDWVPGIIFKAQIMLQAGNHHGAAELLEAKSANHPDQRELRLAYARALAADAQYTEAQTEFTRLLQATPDDRDLLYAVAVLAFQLKDYEKAETHFRKALELGHPESSLINLYFGQLAEERNDLPAAYQAYKRVTNGPNYTEAQIRIALLLAKEGKIDEARAHLHQQLGDENIHQRYLFTELQILNNAKQTQAAFDLLETALKTQPDDPNLLYESAMTAERLDKMDIMESRLRKLIELDPQHAHAYNALGYSLADRGLRLEEAQTLIEKALTLAPDNPFILDSLGWVKFKRGDAGSALTVLEQAYKLSPDPEIAAHLGEILWQLDRKDEANQLLDKALLANPDNTTLQEAISRLRRP